MTRSLPFTKMQGAGNDFVVLDALSGALPPIEPIARRLCDRRFGIGCDQLLVVRPSHSADFRMEIFNPDGSRAEMCANGIRAFFKYLHSRGHTTKEELAVETPAGIVRPRSAPGGLVRVDMGAPLLAPAKIPTALGEGDGPVLDVSLEVDGRPLTLSSIGMGNPHAILFVEDVDAAPVETLGPKIEQHPAFPNRTNVEFVEVVARDRVRQRTWERGTGETLACGSGACAVAVVGILRGVTQRTQTVVLRGGELRLEWPSDTGHVYMTGGAAEVFTGQFPLEGE
jgi:diaminopimelate epimerase